MFLITPRGADVEKISLIEILGVFIYTLAIDEKYPRRNSENLSLPIQMQLSKIRNNFLQFFVPFLEFASSFKYFETKHYRQN